MCYLLQLCLCLSMTPDQDLLLKESLKMMTDMIILCATLALSLFFWVLSLTISTYSGRSEDNNIYFT